MQLMALNSCPSVLQKDLKYFFTNVGIDDAYFTGKETKNNWVVALARGKKSGCDWHFLEEILSLYATHKLTYETSVSNPPTWKVLDFVGKKAIQTIKWGQSKKLSLDFQALDASGYSSLHVAALNGNHQFLIDLNSFE